MSVSITRSALCSVRPFSRPVKLQTVIFTRALSTLRDTRSPSSGTRLHSGRPVAYPKGRAQQQSQDQQTSEQFKTPPQYSDVENTLLTPVNIPKTKNVTLQRDHPAAAILENSAIVIQRQLELGNVLL